MTTPEPQMSLDFVWKRIGFFFRAMIVIEIVFPALPVVLGIIFLAAGKTVDLRSVGFALLLPGVALAIAAAVRILGLHRARADFLTARRQASLRRARRFAMFGLAAGIVLSIVSLMVVAFTPWVTELAGVLAVALVFFAIFLTLMMSFVQFVAERTAMKATAQL